MCKTKYQKLASGARYRPKVVWDSFQKLVPRYINWRRYTSKLWHQIRLFSVDCSQWICEEETGGLGMFLRSRKIFCLGTFQFEQMHDTGSNRWNSANINASQSRMMHDCLILIVVSLHYEPYLNMHADCFWIAHLPFNYNSVTRQVSTYMLSW